MRRRGRRGPLEPLVSLYELWRWAFALWRCEGDRIMVHG